MSYKMFTGELSAQQRTKDRDKRKWMLLNKLFINNVLPLFICIIYQNQSKKDAEILWMYDYKCHLQDCTFDSNVYQRNTV